MLNNQHMAAFNDKAVEFYSANLINQGKCQSNVYVLFGLWFCTMRSDQNETENKQKKN